MTANDQFKTSLHWCCKRVKPNNDGTMICVVPSKREGEFRTLMMDYELRYDAIKSTGKASTLATHYSVR